MNRPAKLLAGLLLLTGFSGLAADQTISFNNNNLGSPRLVTFCPFWFPEVGGQGVRNGVADGASYVAQLFRVLPNGSGVAIGAPANFRAATTTQPGTWSGGTRTVVGVPQGTPLQLQVKAWDASFGSFETAVAAGKAVGASAVFSFQDPMNNPTGATDNFMVNFQGFYVGCVPEPATISLGLLGSLFVLWLPRRNQQ